MRIEVVSGEAGWDLIQGLEAEVYPPEILTQAPWRDVAWAHADKRVLTWTGRAGPACHVGIYLREGLGDGRPLRIGGIGGVMTAPTERGQGLATAAMEEACQFLMHHASADLGLLFCEPQMVGFYERQGWRTFRGEIVVAQPPERAPFAGAGLSPTILPLSGRAPERTIDICGLPW